jgi:GTP cyclohydrolase IA
LRVDTSKIRDRLMNDLIDLDLSNEYGADMIAFAPTVSRSRLALTTTKPPRVDLNAAANAVHDLLLALGEDPSREGLRNTPTRVAKAMAEMWAGRFDDPAKHLKVQFSEAGDNLILVRDIEFSSLCEHHLLPFFGKAQVAYVPGNGRVVGLSKLARTVQTFARRPQVQERLTNQIADALMDHLAARGAAVTIHAEHMCVKLRGVNQRHATMFTSALRGCLRDDALLRSEVLSLMTASPA